MCGQAISTSTTLDMDLSCTGSGIFINANDVTLDLGGHTITGVIDTVGNGFTGVLIGSGRTGATVMNGTIRSFNRGVGVLPGANRASITGLTLAGNATGIGVFTDTTNGILTDGVSITRNTITNTNRSSAIELGGNSHRVEDNTISNGASTGILLFGNDNWIVGNSISGSGGNAISLGPTPNTPGPFTGNQIVADRITGSGRLFNAPSISVTNGAGTLVAGNRVSGNNINSGVFVTGSVDTTVSGNRLEGNGSGVTVRSSSGTLVEANRAEGNGVGIFVESTATGTRVIANKASSNRLDGVRVNAASTTITGNEANGNGQWGIFAVTGVTDGGGNRASGNRTGQCLNVAC